MSNPPALMTMRRLYERGPRSGELTDDREGVVLGSRVVLVRRTSAGYRCVSADDVTRLTRIVFGAQQRWRRFPFVIAAIAEALDSGDIVKAQLLGLTLPLESLGESQLRRLEIAADLLKANYDPDQPRDERGRWTTNGSGSGAGPAQPLQPSAEPVDGRQPVNPGKHPPIDMWDITDERKKPVSVLDDHGHQVLGEDGKPMWRPKDLYPNFFVDKGLAADGAGQIVEDLAQFRQGQPWDAQRVHGVAVRQYRNYATVAIGLYGAAAKIPVDHLLAIQNEYAWWESRFSREEMDDTYRFLPKRNVANTRLGYELYESGRVGPSRKKIGRWKPT